MVAKMKDFQRLFEQTRLLCRGRAVAFGGCCHFGMAASMTLGVHIPNYKVSTQDHTYDS